MRLKIGPDHGLSPALAERLVGDTADEIAANAQGLAAVMDAVNKPRRPPPDPLLGRHSGQPPVRSESEQWADALKVPPGHPGF
ncbi:hypothetical protein [Mycolicibacterium peregrinum]|uniref:hypothetical protein n=1 Tax=Mycolicibacterium peregrinum TaxID=43304 RepID=UPI003AB0AE5E